MDEGSPSAGEYTAGSRIASYLLEEQIGQGGMAVVFRARDERLGRTVAIKILAPALAGDRAFRERFIRESQAAAAMDDPHIIPVFEAGEQRGALFIAMRFVRGGDVRSLLSQGGPLSPEHATEIISQVASALDAAHGQGLVHRDVKPANMLLDAGTGTGRPDHVYLSDFGVSKAQPAPGRLTATGQLLGTLDYMSPEQISGGSVDARTDQYALACAAFELLTGAVPFEGYAGVAVISAQLNEPPPPLTSRRPDLSAAADAVMTRALAKAAADRYPSCGDFADALRGAFGLPPYRTRREATHPPGQEVMQPTQPARFATPSTAAAVPAEFAPRSGTTAADGTVPDPVTVATSVSAARPPETDAHILGSQAGPVVSSAPAAPPGGQAAGARPARAWWRSRGAIAAGIVLLAALGGGAFVLLQPAGGTTASGTVIFRADFTSGANGWTVLRDAAAGHLSGGFYDIAATSSGDDEIGVPVNVRDLYPSAPSDLRIDVTARGIRGPVPDVQYGIACRELHGSAYVFQMQGSTATIAKLASGSYLPLASTRIGAVNAGSAHQLRAECTGVDGRRAARLAFWVNGLKVLDVTDQRPLIGGTVGLFTNFYGVSVPGGVRTRFSDFAVSRL